jgi:hypothetical protein
MPSYTEDGVEVLHACVSPDTAAWNGLDEAFTLRYAILECITLAVGRSPS